MIVLVALALGSSSCAYYNTYYLAKRYYSTATGGMPYPVEKPTGAQAGNYQKSIEYSKKVIANYPKSKWVDDAYLMWAQGLLGKDDPLQTATMLQDFHRRYPDSPRAAEATFYLGVAFRQARKPREALVALDEFVETAPKHELMPYAHLERSRSLTALSRPTEAAAAASQVIDLYPKSPLVVRARAERAEALLAGGDPVAARQDFMELGARATDDDARFAFLLREADCLEAARDYGNALILLQGALAHEPAPIKSASGAVPTGPGVERYGQLTMRIGTIHLQAGHSDQALAAYRNVLQDYPKTGLAAEAQYRIAYTYETALDDFTTARQEYAKVRDQSVSSTYFAQAVQRQQSLDRLERFRGAGADSIDKKVEAGFLLAEQYLFQLDKPDRAAEAYAAIALDYPGTPHAGKAMNAQAWVLRHKLDRPTEADTLLWHVVREYPATEAQLAARDYLEAAGHAVPPELIQAPSQPQAPADTMVELTAPPAGPMPIGPAAQGVPSIATSDPSAAARGAMIGPALPGAFIDTSATQAPSPNAAADSIARAMATSPAQGDSAARAQAATKAADGGGKVAAGAGAGAAIVGGAQPGGTVGPQSGTGPNAPSGASVAPQAGPGPSVPTGGGAAAAGAGAAAGIVGGAPGSGKSSGPAPQAGPQASGASPGGASSPGSPSPTAPGLQTGAVPAPGPASIAGATAVARPDSAQRALADTTQRAAADTTRRAPADTTLRARPPRPATPARPDTVWAPR